MVQGRHGKKWMTALLLAALLLLLTPAAQAEEMPSFRFSLSANGKTEVQAQPGDVIALLLRLDMRGLAVSAGSACTAGSTDPSHVLLALGLDERQANESIRFSLSDDNTEAEVDAAIALLRELLA